MDKAVIAVGRFDLVIFDLDGVVTKTAAVHAAAWKALFDAFLRRKFGAEALPFDIDTDYRAYVDGKPRYDGVRDFLASRNITLPEGSPDDSPAEETVYGLGNTKDALFLERIGKDGVAVYPHAVDLIHRLKSVGILTALVTSSRNGKAVLDAAGLGDLFDQRVDGVVRAELGLRGKPAPDTFLEAARRLNITPARAAVFEDALSGVEAGRAGGFGLVVGVDRAGQSQALLEHGADVAVADLANIEVRDLGSALNDFSPVARTLKAGPIGIFLDYDGTLTAIVDHPEDARLTPAMRDVLRRLGGYYPVAIVTGRDLTTIKDLVGLDGLIYAAEHGFDIALADGRRIAHDEAAAARPAIEDVARKLRTELKGIDGLLMERKRFSLAVHYRLVAPTHVDRVCQAVRDAVSRHPELHILSGKKVEEIQPRIDWDKGKAVAWLRRRILPASAPALYLGDDTTDEDVFRTLVDGDIGVLVRDRPRPTAAHYVLNGVGEVGPFLERLIDRADRTDHDR